ncbi:hypothetical protein RMCBS344292_07603 [Rhizopus microsporus]|nr:hypothetical protein RMCBS344292_07603 [Rhizopus microsporus]
MWIYNLLHDALTSNILQSLQGDNERRVLKVLLDEQLWELIEKADLAAKYAHEYFQLVQNNASVGSRDPALEVQVLEHLASSEIPLMASEAGRILGLGNLVWKLKIVEEDFRNLHQNEERIQKLASVSTTGIGSVVFYIE